MGRPSHSRGVIPCHIQPRSVIISIRNHAFGYPPAGDTLKTRAGDHAGHPSRVPGPAAAARPPLPCSSRVMTRPAPPRPGQCRLTSGHGPGAAAPGSAPSSPPYRHPGTAARPGTHGVSSTTERTRQWPGPCRSRLSSRWTQPGRQPGRSSRWPARRGGGRAGGSLHHAGRTAVAADPRSPRSRRPGQRAGPVAAATPAPGTAGRGHARIGRCRTGRDGARRPAGGGARGRRDHAGGRGGVRAPGPVHRRHRAGRPRAGADARRGAGDPAGADAVPGGDRNQGVHQPGRGRPRADPAAAARRGRRGICWAAAWWPPGSRRTARPGWPP